MSDCAPNFDCQDDDQRREWLRATDDWNGLDYVEVNGNEICLFFINKVSDDLANRLEANPNHVQITGGRRIRDLQAVSVVANRSPASDVDDCVNVTLDREGDFSTYCLCLVEVAENGSPTDQAMQGIDPRYSCVEVRFRIDCDPGVNCLDEAVEDNPVDFDEPVINYLAKDYNSFRQLILDRLSLIMPDWNERHVPDILIALVEVLAYTGDHLSYYQDAVATEAYLNTAQQQISVRRHARLVDYHLHEGCSARAFVQIAVSAGLELEREAIYFAAGLPPKIARLGIAVESDLTGIPKADYVVFEPVQFDDRTTISLIPAHNEIHFYTWGETNCCLPAGATRAALLDEWVLTDSEPTTPADDVSVESPPPTRVLQLAAGDVLIFEEVLGAKTGDPADANPKRRHSVRLTSVEQSVDPLVMVSVGDHQYPLPVVEIEWDSEDALPFPLCISSIAEITCELLENVSVARGNVVLVDHGRRVWEDLGNVPLLREDSDCDDCRETIPVAGRFLPILSEPNLTYAEPVSTSASAWAMQQQDPRAALPAIDLTSEKNDPLDNGLLGVADILPEAYSILASVTDNPDPRLAFLAPRLSAQTFSLLALLEEEPTLELQQALASDFNALLRGSTPFYDEAVTPRDRFSDATRALLDAALIGDPPLPGSTMTRLNRMLLQETFPDLIVTDENTPDHWYAHPDLFASQPDERHYAVEIDNRALAHLRFGSEGLGLPPAADLSFAAYYRVGCGIDGNVAAEAINLLIHRETRISGVSVTVRNPLAAVGGIDPEPQNDVKMIAPFAFRDTLERAIIADDYAAIAQRDTRLQRAASVLRWTGSWYEALTAVDAIGGEAAPDLLDGIETTLHHYRRIGHDLDVRAAVAVPLDLAFDVCVKPDYLREHVKSELQRVFSNRRLRGGQLGFFHPDRLSFGQGIYLSDLIATAQAVEGVDSVQLRRFERRFETSTEALDQGVLPLRPMEIARLDNDPNQLENGRIEFVMRGGR